MIDTHCHLDLVVQKLQTITIDQLLNSLEAVVVPGLYHEQWQTITDMSRSNQKIKIAFGYHPYWLEEKDFHGNLENFRDRLVKQVASELAKGIGECGIDSNMPVKVTHQQKLFELQLEVAREYKLPVIIHSIKSHHLILESLKKIPSFGVIHSFSGSIELAQEYIQKDIKIGVGGTITYPRAKKTRRTIQHIPLEQILLETDAPDMPLCGKQGRCNKPEYISEVAKSLSKLIGITPEKVLRTADDTAKELFKI